MKIVDIIPFKNKVINPKHIVWYVILADNGSWGYTSFTPGQEKPWMKLGNKVVFEYRELNKSGNPDKYKFYVDTKSTKAINNEL